METIAARRSGRRVFLVDDHPLVREGVRAFLASHSITVAGEASDGREALRKVAGANPDVVVLDVNLPSMDGGELARRLRRLVPRCRLIAFSVHSSREYVVKMARCGVQGYVSKDQPARDLLEAVRTVSAGGVSFPPGMAEALLAPEILEDRPGRVALTPRELSVLALLAEGHSNKGVAAKLGISVRTSETHRENLSRKLAILSVAGLTKYALAHGLTTL